MNPRSHARHIGNESLMIYLFNEGHNFEHTHVSFEKNLGRNFQQGINVLKKNEHLGTK